MKLIVTGFGKFGGVEHNPTERLIELLEERNGDLNATVEGALPQLRTQVLKVAAQEVKEWIESLFQDHDEGEVIVVHLGVASKAECLRIERQAFNEANFRIPDEDGWQPQHERILEALPLGSRLLTQLPLPTLLDSLQRKGYPVKLSKDAGRFVCNWAYCISLARCSHHTKPPPSGRAWDHSGISGVEPGGDHSTAQGSGEGQGQAAESDPESNADTLAEPAASTAPLSQGQRGQLQEEEGTEASEGAGMAARQPRVGAPSAQIVTAAAAATVEVLEASAPAIAAAVAVAAAKVEVLEASTTATAAAGASAAPAAAATHAALEEAEGHAEAGMAGLALDAGEESDCTGGDVSSSEDEGLQEGMGASWHHNWSYALFVHVPPFEVVPERVQFSFLLDLLDALVHWARAEENGQQEGISSQEGSPIQQYAQA